MLCDLFDYQVVITEEINAQFGKKAEVSIQAEINHCAETIMCNSTIMKTGRDYGFVT